MYKERRKQATRILNPPHQKIMCYLSPTDSKVKHNTCKTVNLKVKNLLAAFFAIISTFAADASSFDHSWDVVRWSPCEGVGISGSSRVYIEGTSDAVKNGINIIHTSIWISSAMASENRIKIGAKLLVKREKAVIQGVSLREPNGSSIEVQRKDNESNRLYLANGENIIIPSGGKLWAEVNIAVKTDSGWCHIANTEEIVLSN